MFINQKIKTIFTHGFRKGSNTDLWGIVSVCVCACVCMFVCMHVCVFLWFLPCIRQILVLSFMLIRDQEHLNRR